MEPAFRSTVCVMDASGRLGSSLVERLLQRGYTVHAAVQNHIAGDQVQQFSGISSPENEKRLKVFHLDPFDYQSIIEALKGCCGLFYSFEPAQDQPTFDEVIAEEEVRVAHNVLEACAQTDSIAKVVFTSSATAIFWREDHSSMEVDFDERHWSDISLCRKFKLWYALSKTAAEKAAWAMAMDRGMNMVTINAGLLLGPELSLTNPCLKGAAEMYEDGVFVTVDLNYLVDAHICAFENVSAYGRYLCFNHIINSSEDTFKLTQILTPSASLPSQQSYKEDTRIIPQRISNKKLNKLMVDFESGIQVEG
ncbi:NAD-dependent epimerase/dehydratase [Dillenia turbinata]|uniref:NAD-dependent epimerase/dehydratase n=1 Tax=Dillenia turbinata TaxID=194707 RepID=A0AAN8WFH4_9MAGN